MIKKLFTLFFILFFSFIYSDLISQIWQQKIDSLSQLDKRPKIGLALSGGAAHGLSHIGAIKYLEEQGIPVDYVTGTSMGAIIGAMYALGANYQEMEELVTRYDWDAIISNFVNLQELDPLEKPYHNKIPIKLRVEKAKILLPEAFFEGYKLDLKIQEIFSAAFLTEDFDALPRPFRCYSVDLLSGQVFEHSEGSLSEAVRASLAIPSVFTPVRKDSMLLVDGGLVKNFPVKEAFELGADIVIGVYVGSKRSKIEEVNSISEILKLTGFLTSLNDTEQQKSICDILIEPDVKDYPILDFSFYETFKDEGYNAAKNKVSQIKDLQELLSNYPPSTPFIPIKMPDELFLEDVQVNPRSQYAKLIYNNFQPLERDNINIEKFNQAINNSLASQDIKTVKVNLEEGSLGQILNIDYEVNQVSNVGFTLNSFSNTNTSVILSGTLRNMILPMTIARGFARIGNNAAIGGSMYHRTGENFDLLFGGELTLSKFKDPIFREDLGRKEFTYDEFKLVPTFKYLTGKHSQITASYGLYNRSVKPQEINTIDIRDFDQNLQKLYLSYEKNTLDRWPFPTSGSNFKIGGSILHNLHQEVTYNSGGAKEVLGIPAMDNNFNFFVTNRSYSHLSHKMVSEASVSYGYYDHYSLVDYFRIGGSETYTDVSLPFIGSEQGEFRLQHYLYLRSAFRYQVANSIYLTLAANILQGKSFNETFFDKTIIPEWKTVVGVGLSAGIETIIGPINIDFGYKNESDNLNFSIGVGYRHIY